MKPHEPEHQGPIWKHPYLIYVVLTAVLFAILVGLGYVAYRNGAIPDRGIERSGAR
jgi:hypothetical protein